MQHIKQSTNYSCGAAAFAMITGVSEKEAAFRSKTTAKGTSVNDTERAFIQLNIPVKRIQVDLVFEAALIHLKLLSNQYKIYASCEFISNCGRGRNSHRHHAISIWKEQIYDPAQCAPRQIDCISDLYNRELIIKEIILVNFPK